MESSLRIKNFKSSDTVRLCAMHFTENEYFGKSDYTCAELLTRFLKKSAVPSIFCFMKTKIEIQAAQERQHRCEKRCQRKLIVDQLTDKPSTSTLSDAPSILTDASSISNDVPSKFILLVDHEEELSMHTGNTMFAQIAN